MAEAPRVELHDPTHGLGGVSYEWTHHPPPHDPFPVRQTPASHGPWKKGHRHERQRRHGVRRVHAGGDHAAGACVPRAGRPVWILIVAGVLALFARWGSRRNDANEMTCTTPSVRPVAFFRPCGRNLILLLGAAHAGHHTCRCVPRRRLVHPPKRFVRSIAAWVDGWVDGTLPIGGPCGSMTSPITTARSRGGAAAEARASRHLLHLGTRR